jgi:DNA-binding MarR family transcriptional regulator
MGEAILVHHAAARREGLTLIQWAVLKLLDLHGPRSPSDLAADLGISRPAITSSINTLEGRGWVRRSVAGGDRRRRETALTARSRGVLARVGAERRRFLARGLSRLAPAEREAFARSAEHLLTILRVPEASASTPARGRSRR